MSHLYHHHGIKATTESGRQWLFHNDGKAGVVATPASNMSRRWKEIRQIPINNQLIAQNIMNVMSSSMSIHIAGPTGWLLSGTCIGSARRAEKALSGE